ncbi:hypothetical protein PS6_010089 [Mucor atramentarius]
MSSYMAHSDLPQPAIFKHAKPRQDELSTTLQAFLDRHAVNANGTSKIEGVMLYLKKPEIQNYLEQQGYKCTPSSTTAVIQCVKTKPSSSLAKL